MENNVRAYKIIYTSTIERVQITLYKCRYTHKIEFKTIRTYNNVAICIVLLASASRRFSRIQSILLLNMHGAMNGNFMFFHCKNIVVLNPAHACVTLHKEMCNLMETYISVHININAWRLV